MSTCSSLKKKWRKFEQPTIPNTSIDLTRFSAQGGGAASSGLDLKKAFDKDSATYWTPKSLDGGTNWIKIFNPTRLLFSKVTLQGDESLQNVTAVFAQASDDGVSWEDLPYNQQFSGNSLIVEFTEKPYKKYIYIGFEGVAGNEKVYEIEIDAQEVY